MSISSQCGVSKNSLELLLIMCFLVLHWGCSSPETETETEPVLTATDHTDPLDNYTDWSIYRGDKKGNQYAELAQIHAANVHKLELVWQYRTGDANDRSSMQVNPIMVDGLLYFSTPTLRAVALDAATGEEVWVFKSEDYNESKKLFRGRTRGVTYWEMEDGSEGRIFLFVKDRVYALNAKSGELIEDFGKQGHIDLRQNLDMDIEQAAIEVTTPGAVYQNMLIVGSRVPEGYNSTPGHIRAYDALTGEFKWIFHTIPKPGEFGYDSWTFEEGEKYGGANAWGGFTIDEQRGWVFCATGSPAFDFYGGNRKGMNLFGNCVLALDALTGERIWHYQTVHHDIWDYDNPPAPVLVTLNNGDESKDAVVQFTKMGLTFVLDRETGEPIFPVEEMKVPVSTIDGEQAWPTQPIPVKPLPLTRQGITEVDLTNISPSARQHVLRSFKQYAKGPIYTPPTEVGTITSPGLFGGVEWHGGSFDPHYGIMYVNSNDAPTVAKLRKVYGPNQGGRASDLQIGQYVYLNNCSACHGVNREGVPPTYPGLNNLTFETAEIENIVRNGKNLMPAFSQLDDQEIAAVASYVQGNKHPLIPAADYGKQKVRYALEGYVTFRDDQGYPAIAPPWGTLNAIDLNSGDFVWRIPLGEYPELVEQGIRNTGTLNYGGAVATAGGVVFIAATADEKIRAFEKSRGKLLWEYKLPVGGYATPSIFMKDGRQYVVIVAGGGGKNGTPSGDYVMAFALPQEVLDSRTATIDKHQMDQEGWISLFDGHSLDGWVHMNGSHSYTVENGAIIGRTTPNSHNSFLCSLQEFDNFELECEVMVDTITNQGIQFRSSARPVTEKDHHNWRAGRVWGPQVEVRQSMGDITTGVLYGEALGTGWLSSEEKKENGHDFFIPNGWNKIRLVADGPRMQTYVNGNLVEDLVNEEVYQTHPKGFIGLQIHGIDGERQFIMGWRNIRVRPIAK